MKPRVSVIAYWLISLLAYIFIGYFLKRENFLEYMTAYVLLFAGFIYLWKRYSSPQIETGNFSLQTLLLAAIFFRLIFLFSIPSLSDDFYRFLWDGKMMASGQNPYTIIPSFYILFSDEHPSYLWSLFSKMNSQDYYTVYPPVCQFIFGLASKLFSENFLSNIAMIRACCIVADIGNIFLIQKLLRYFKMPAHYVILYAFNPLIIIELSGNIHPEAIMIFFLLLAVWLLIRERLTLSALAMGISIDVKLIPLLFLPFLIKRLGWKKSLLYFFICGATVLLLFLPFINSQLIDEYGSSLNLYFQHFEFNASFFYLIRYIGTKMRGYDLVQVAGPALALITFLSVSILVILEKNMTIRHLILSMQWALTIYLLLATTVHPWYITALVMISVFTQYRFIIAWSLLVALSYNTYQTHPYYENLWFTVLEYVVVLSVFLWELIERNFNRDQQESSIQYNTP